MKWRIRYLGNNCWSVRRPGSDADDFVLLFLTPAGAFNITMHLIRWGAPIFR